MTRFQGVREFTKMMLAGGVRTDRFDSAATIEDLRRLAMKKTTRMAFDFVDGAADAENTRQANIDDLREVLFEPRNLVDISNINTKVDFAGVSLDQPFVLGPAGLMRMVHGDGELSAVRAAGRSGIPYTISSASSWSIEEIAEHARSPLWFQLYMYRNDDVVTNLISRAKAANCEVLIVTVDVPVIGNRVRDHRNGMSIPPQITPQNFVNAIRHPKWIYDLIQGPPIGFRNLQGIAQGSGVMSHQAFITKELNNLKLTWEALPKIRRQWDGPLLVKGICTVADAERAKRFGSDGIYISNHGGRQLDSTPSAISALPRIVDAVGNDLKIVMDGGIRHGSDIVKALSLGADLVSIGRSWVYGLAAGGERGVARSIDILRDELEQTLGLLGCPDVADLDRSFVTYPSAWHGEGRIFTKQE